MELKSCPFDDGDAFIKTIEYVPPTDRNEYYVHCKLCTVRKGPYYYYSEAIHAWNERIADNSSCEEE